MVGRLLNEPGVSVREHEFAFWMLGGSIVVLGKIEAKLIRGAKLIFPVGLHTRESTLPALENSISSTVTYKTELEQIFVLG